MTAFDGRGDDLHVFFDSDGPEVKIATTDQLDNWGGASLFHYSDIPQMVQDLLDAYAIRGGDVMGLLEREAEDRNGGDQ